MRKTFHSQGHHDVREDQNEIAENPLLFSCGKVLGKDVLGCTIFIIELFGAIKNHLQYKFKCRLSLNAHK